MAKNVSPPSYADVLKESVPTAPATENKNQEASNYDLYPNLTQEDVAPSPSPNQDPNDQRMPSKAVPESDDQQAIKSDSNPDLNEKGVLQPPSPVEEPNEIVLKKPHIASKRPITVICPHCKEKILTETNKKNGVMTLVLVIILCFISCPLACAPYCCKCCDCCDDVEHQCPKCGNSLGIHKTYHYSNFC